MKLGLVKTDAVRAGESELCRLGLTRPDRLRALWRGLNENRLELCISFPAWLWPPVWLRLLKFWRLTGRRHDAQIHDCGCVDLWDSGVEGSR